MTEEHNIYDEIPLPVLLRHGRNTYGSAMRKALAEAGYDDIPGNGLYIIGGLAMDSEDVPLGRLIREMRLTKQAAGQLVDTLVMRGYLERATDKDDRRKLTITLTERGRAAADVQRAAREKVDAELLASVGADDVSRTKRTLAVLVDMGCEAQAASDEGD